MPRSIDDELLIKQQDVNLKLTYDIADIKQHIAVLNDESGKLATHIEKIDVENTDAHGRINGKITLLGFVVVIMSLVGPGLTSAVIGILPMILKAIAGL